MDAFSLAAKSGENPFETKSYDDGFQSANSFFSGGSQSQLDVVDQPASKTTAGTSTAASATISSSASMPLYDGKSTSSGYPLYRPKDGVAVAESTTDAHLYELHGDVSPDSGLQTSLA